MHTDTGNKKPDIVAIDVEYAVDALKALLAPTDVQVMYYPPPSAEEMAYANRTNPYLSKADKDRNLRPVCAVCEAEFSSADGSSPLFKCGRCKEEHYCSKEHQKLHWKWHKKMCFESKA